MSGGARSPAAGVFRRALDGIDQAVAVLIIAAMGGMVVVVTAQVYLRYVHNLSIDWADEISRLLFVWSIFLAIPLGIKRGAHVGVELLVNVLPAGVRDRLFRFMNVLAIVLMAVVAWQAGVLTYGQWDEPMSTLDVSVGLFMLPISFGAVHSIFHLLVGTLAGVPPKTTAVAE
ncbi:MAG: TRAP transporter small permease [Hyphomicrobiaceae bacterium]